MGFDMDLWFDFVILYIYIYKGSKFFGDDVLYLVLFEMTCQVV